MSDHHPDLASQAPDSIEAYLKKERRLFKRACWLMGLALLGFIGFAGLLLWLRLTVVPRHAAAAGVGVDLPLEDLSFFKTFVTIFGLGTPVLALVGLGYLIAWMVVVNRRRRAQ